METTFIYGLTNSENIIRYIGKSDDPEKRLKQHIKEIRRYPSSSRFPGAYDMFVFDSHTDDES